MDQHVCDLYKGQYNSTLMWPLLSPASWGLKLVKCYQMPRNWFFRAHFSPQTETEE